MNAAAARLPALLLALAFLLPPQGLPWPAVFKDAAMGLALLLLAWRWAPNAWVPAQRLWWLFALLPLAHCVLTGRGAFGEAWMATVYLGGFALAVGVGSRADFRAGAAPKALAKGVLSAAWISVALALLQVLSWPLLPEGWQAAASMGGRAGANLGQPNLLATLLLLALLVVIGCWRLRSWSTRRAAWAAAPLLLGLALTQSRTGLLGLLLLVIALSRSGTARAVPLGLSLPVVALVALAMLKLPGLWAWLHPDEVAMRALQEVHSLDARWGHWQGAWRAFLETPWRGHGWGETATALAQLGERLPATGERIEQAHNLVLDLLLWQGAPLTLLMLAALGWTWWRHAARPLGPVAGLAALGLALLFLHALVEYPLHYGLFLWPAGLLLGLTRAPVAAGSIPATGIVWALAAALSLADAMRLAPAIRARQEAILSAPAQDLPRSPSPIVLTQLGDQLRLLDGLRSSEPQDLLELERLSQRWGHAPALLRLAERSRAAGDEAAAVRLLGRLCRTHPERVCSTARAWLTP